MKQIRIKLRLLGSVLLILAFAATNAVAQTNIESNAGIQLDFSNPGARSMALGGAFVGLADDATAGFTNPAGLRSVSRKEFSIEIRGRSFRTPYTSGGRLSGSPSGLGADDSAQLQFGESRETAADLSFASFVYPGSRWAVAAYRQQLSNFRYKANSSGAFFEDADGDQRLFPYQADLDVKIARYGASGSYDVSPRLSVGGGVFFYDFVLSSNTRRFAVSSVSPDFYAAPDFQDTPLVDNVQKGGANSIGFTTGITARPAGDWQFGIVYRHGAELPLVTSGASSGAFTIPNAFSAGVSVPLGQAAKVMVDYSLVQYSKVSKNFTLLFPPLPGFTATSQDFTVDDANELHVGLEYVFINAPHPFAVRFGSWYDPDHAIRFAPSILDGADPYNLATFRRGKNVVHGSVGAGIAIGRLEINGAADVSSRTTIVSIAMVGRF